ncbi:MAG: recombination mediator RecR [Rickettsiales bacterium]|jgi:recombination protein RecR|nr:recombination mediator RecR [Rickettsiales bacterium]
MILLDKLILQFSKLPRIGRRAAGRIAISLLQDKARARELAAALAAAAEKIRACPVCGCLCEDDLCEYCADGARAGLLCIVRDYSDVSVIEKAGVFRGRYHIIGGLLSGANGITPGDLNISTLGARIEAEGTSEVIFALPNTLEGKTTQSYVASRIAGVACSELASGVPLGGDLDFIDDGTLTLAFGGRKRV